jgi:hypothetical protein
MMQKTCIRKESSFYTIKLKGGNFELSSKLKTYIYSVCRRIWLKEAFAAKQEDQITFRTLKM